MTTIAVAEGFTADDLDDLPDDGQRYELVDGLLLVTPSPAERHQRAVMDLSVLPANGCPSGLRVYGAPLDVRFSLQVQVQPDLLVTPDGPPRDKLELHPLLCVEVLSPGTRRDAAVPGLAAAVGPPALRRFRGSVNLRGRRRRRR